MKYIILSSKHSEAELGRIKNKMIRKGWTPIGGIYKAHEQASGGDNSAEAFCQVMTKESEKKIELVTETEPVRLKEKIQKLLDEGWNLHGNMVTKEEQGLHVLVQAMIFDEDTYEEDEI